MSHNRKYSNSIRFISLAFAATLGFLTVGVSSANAVTSGSVTIDTTNVNLNAVVTGSITTPTGCSGTDPSAEVSLKGTAANGRNFSFSASLPDRQTTTQAFTDAVATPFSFNSTSLNPTPIANGTASITGYECLDWSSNTTIEVTLTAPIVFTINAFAAPAALATGTNWTLTPTDDHAKAQTLLSRVCNGGGGFDVGTEYTWGVIYYQNDSPVAAVPAGFEISDLTGEANMVGFAAVNQTATRISVPTTGITPGEYTAEIICTTKYANSSNRWLNHGFKTAVTITEAPATELANTGRNVMELLWIPIGLLVSGAGLVIVRRNF